MNIVDLLIITETKTVYLVDGSVLRALREARGQQQRDVAAYLGISAGHLCKIERENAPMNVSQELAERIEEWGNGK